LIVSGVAPSATSTLRMLGSATSTPATMIAMITTGATVHAVSSRVLPRICGPSISRPRPRLR
jgi:hypothetical protein